MRNLESRLTRLESAYPAGHALEEARAFVRCVLEIKSGCKVPDGRLLDHLAAWGAKRGLSVRGHLDAMARVDRMASYLGGDETVPGAGECTNVFGMEADGLLAFLDAGQVDEYDLLTLFSLKPQEC